MRAQLSKVVIDSSASTIFLRSESAIADSSGLNIISMRMMISWRITVMR